MTDEHIELGAFDVIMPGAFKERLDWGLTFDAAWREEDPVTDLPDPPKFNYEKEV
jgi:hypothetical protein